MRQQQIVAITDTFALLFAAGETVELIAVVMMMKAMAMAQALELMMMLRILSLLGEIGTVALPFIHPVDTGSAIVTNWQFCNGGSSWLGL